MRSVLSEDLQGNRWWLASDGRWYPPDLHPNFRAGTPDEHDRNKALLNATIGVARVRERVFAEVRGEHRREHLADRAEEGRRDTSSAIGRRGLEKTNPMRREAEPVPRFRARGARHAPRVPRTIPAPRLWSRAALEPDEVGSTPGPSPGIVLARARRAGSPLATCRGLRSAGSAPSRDLTPPVRCRGRASLAAWPPSGFACRSNRPATGTAGGTAHPGDPPASPPATAANLAGSSAPSASCTAGGQPS